MRIIVKAKPSAKQEKVERLTQPSLHLEGTKIELDIYKVSVKEPPVSGRANDAIIRALAGYFDVAPSKIRLVSGQTSKKKIFEIG